MQAAKQFSLVQDMPATARAEDRSPTERVFDHWVFMTGRNPARCVLGPMRRKVIERALALYGGDDEVPMLAVEGGASSAWHAGENDDGRAHDDVEFFLRNEVNIERFAAMGEALRARAERALQQQVRDVAARAVVQTISGEDVAQARARMLATRQAVALRMRGGAR